MNIICNDCRNDIRKFNVSSFCMVCNCHLCYECIYYHAYDHHHKSKLRPIELDYIEIESDIETDDEKDLKSKN